jgi:hypothetical protein
MRISEIDWSKAEFIGKGSSSRVYRVALGLVVKLKDWMDRDEPTLQGHLSMRGLAVPVLEFDQECETVPQELRRQIRPCLIHDRNSKKEWHSCTCNDPCSVLLMPEVTDPYQHVTYLEVIEFVDRLDDLIGTEYRTEWDSHEGNVGWYKEHLVGLDFERGD